MALTPLHYRAGAGGLSVLRRAVDLLGPTKKKNSLVFPEKGSVREYWPSDMSSTIAQCQRVLSSTDSFRVILSLEMICRERATWSS